LLITGRLPTAACPGCRDVAPGSGPLDRGAAVRDQTPWIPAAHRALLARRGVHMHTPFTCALAVVWIVLALPIAGARAAPSVERMERLRQAEVVIVRGSADHM